jgi:hypothetical protein
VLLEDLMDLLLLVLLELPLLLEDLLLLVLLGYLEDLMDP